jgi:hypothetical protein
MTVHGRPRWMSTSRSSWNSVSLRFTPRLIGAARTAKLLDFREQLAELEANRNPVAALVLAHLAAQQTRADPARRLQEKLALTRRLYDLGYSPEQRKAGAYASPVQSHGCFRTGWIDYWSPLK